MAAAAPHWELCSGQGPHLLLIHGFLASRAQWQPNLDALRRVCRPVLLELYGHGRSPTPKAIGCYETASYAKAIDDVRRQLGVADWFVCGYSLGAAITLRYALDFPQRVRGHAFTNSASAFAEPELVAAWRAGARASAERVRSGGRAAVERMAVHPKRARRLPPAVRTALLADAALIDPDGVAGALEATLPTASVRAELKDNARPALLVCGRFEKRFAPHREHVAAAMPHLSVVDVDSGHAVNMQAADAFDDALAAFVARLSPSSPP